MIHASIAELAQALAPRRRLLGLDVGTKTIGLALSDVTRTVATPFETLMRVKLTADAGKIAAIVAKHEVGGLVIGLPINMDGSDGPMAQRARQFARDMAERLKLPVALWDERLTSVEANRVLRESGMRPQERARSVDQVAAVLLLENFLEAQRMAAVSGPSIDE